MSRRFMVKTEPVGEGFILGLREQFASSTIDDGTSLTWDHAFGFGTLVIAVTVEFPDGEHVSETMHLDDLLVKWGTAVVREHQVVAP